MKYLILTNLFAKHPLIETDSRGLALTFPTYKAAKAYADKYGIESYTIVTICDDERNYLV